MANKCSDHMALPRRHKKMLAFIADPHERGAIRRALIAAHKSHMDFRRRKLERRDLDNDEVEGQTLTTTEGAVNANT